MAATGDDEDEVQILTEQQYRDMMRANYRERDLDLAFRLQFQEAIAASLSSGTSSSPPPVPELHHTDRAFNVGSLRRIERSTFKIERPIREVGTSSSASSPKFSVYFKSFVRDWLIGNSDVPVVVGGIGIAICDSEGNLIFELGKPISGNVRNSLEADCCALIEALNAALSLNLTRVDVYSDSLLLFQYIRGRLRPEQGKIMALVDQVSLLWNKFAFVGEVLIEQTDNKYAFKLAREALDAQLNQQPPESSSTLEICVICLDDKLSTQMFHTNNCSHRYCFSCMKQHVEEKLLVGILPKCPDEECNFELKIESCEVFLPLELIEIFRHRIKEASIPANEKVYCPFPKCSTLMSKNLIPRISVSRRNGARRCVKCNNIFCINCKVPWHENLSCYKYKRLNNDSLVEEVKLMNLANYNLWRQCKNCNHMIELVSGCRHITCRCGYQFCYTCGFEWKNNKATCSCLLWDDDDIIDEDEDELDFHDFYEDEGDGDDNNYMDEEDYEEDNHIDEDVILIIDE